MSGCAGIFSQWNSDTSCHCIELDEQIEFVQFIETGVASLVNTMKNGDAAEVGTIGNEGMVGLPVVFGDSQAPTCVYMQVAGRGLQMKAKTFWEEMQRSATLRKAMLHYAQRLFQPGSAIGCLQYFSSPGAALLPLAFNDA